MQVHGPIQKSLDSVLRERAHCYYAACLNNRKTHDCVMTYEDALQEVRDAHERTQKRVRNGTVGIANTTTT